MIKLFIEVFVATMLMAMTIGQCAARADCETEATATPTSTCVVLSRGSARGVWFALPLADTLRQEHLLVPELQLQVDRLTQLSDIQTSRATAYREAADLRLQAANVLDRQLTASLGREARAREELGAWYREPAFWFAVGVAVALAVVLVAAAAK